MEGENGDYLTIIGTMAGYLLRNALNLSEDQMEQARAMSADLIDERRAWESATEREGPVPDQAAPDVTVTTGGRVLDATAVGAV